MELLQGKLVVCLEIKIDFDSGSMVLETDEIKVTLRVLSYWAWRKE